MRFNVFNLMLVTVIFAQFVVIYQQATKQSDSRGDLVPVVFPLRSIPPGVALKQEYLTVAYCTPFSVGDGCYSDVESVVGKVVKKGIRVSQPISESHFNLPIEWWEIPKGYKVCAVKCASPKKLQPGDIVNVHAKSGAAAPVIARNVQVFSTNGSTRQIVVGLLVDETQAIELVNSQQQGVIGLTLVSSAVELPKE